MNNLEHELNDAQLLRIRAEKQMKANHQEPDKPAIESDVKKLLHELQVHQIELEMQNEELRQANETAEAALKKYTMLYDFAPMGYFTLDAEGAIRDLNFTAAEMLGDKRFALINSNFKLFIAEESRLVFNNFFSKLHAGKAKEFCKVMLGYDNNPLCLVYMEGIITEEDHQCLLSVVDISDF